MNMHSIRSRLRQIAVQRLVPVQGRQDLVKLGSAYGGWYVAADLIGPDALCICAGVGEDASFDMRLIEQFRASVHGLDPTPRAIAYVEREHLQERGYRFHPVGLWREDTTLFFYSPRKKEHVSHSIVNLQQTSDGFDAPVMRLRSFLDTIGGNAPIDVLKIDIEGAEHAVLADVLGDAIRPRQILVEFDQPASISRVVSTINLVRDAGYAVAGLDKWNVTFVQRDHDHDHYSRI
ncbi:MAG: FkbM family methyltransferase [Thermomicrobiales bacterium]